MISAISESWLRDRLKATLSDRSRRRLRRLGRARWLTKARLVRIHGVGLRCRPWLALKYVAWDPEVESFSWELANRDDAIDLLSGLLEEPAAAIRDWFAEADEAPQLHAHRWDWQTKRRLPLANRALWYVVARSLKPHVIVETGVHEGLGSLVLLTALERNHQEGHDGRLISFDVAADTGRLVPEGMLSRWRRVIAPTDVALERELAGLEVGMSVHDTPPTALRLRELESVVAHAADQLAIVEAWFAPDSPLAALAADRGGRHAVFHGRSSNHVHPGGQVGLAYIERPR